ncbi:MAG: hypothetical protein ACK557_05405, partial [Planctomycetota bacterium]
IDASVIDARAVDASAPRCWMTSRRASGLARVPAGVRRANPSCKYLRSTDARLAISGLRGAKQKLA